MFKCIEFQCEACQHIFDALMAPDEAPPPCPLCQEKTKPILGNPGHTRHVSMSSWRTGHAD